MGTILMGIFTYCLYLSYYNGFLVVFDFNGIGEGPLEMVLFPILTVACAIGTTYGVMKHDADN